MSKLPVDPATMATAAATSLISAVPVLGVPIAQLTNAHLMDRKQKRLAEGIDGLREGLRDLEDKVSEDYVRTEDFEELWEQTWRRIVGERKDGIRSRYVKFLCHVLTHPGGDYDSQEEVLQSMGNIRDNDVAVLKAMAQEPTHEESSIWASSPGQVLAGRTGLDASSVQESAEKLHMAGMTNTPDVGVLMTGSGATHLQGRVTSLGTRFMESIGPESTLESDPASST